MGYTHYWRPTAIRPTYEEWEEICNEARQIIERHRSILCYEYDQPKREPLVNKDQIRFNGKEDEGCETFLLRRCARGFDFCKTSRRPYDDAAVEVLRAVRRICPNWLRLSSDGDGESGRAKVFP